jgi:hypothetical protein
VDTMNRPIVAMNLIIFLLAASGLSAELFRYRGAAREGGTLEYVFDAGESERAAQVCRSPGASEFLTQLLRNDHRTWPKNEELLGRDVPAQ